MTKITKAFLDALYAFLDGLVNLASEESPTQTQSMELRSLVGPSGSGAPGSNPLELIKVDDPVRPKQFADHSIPLLNHVQEIRILLVVSNFEHLQQSLIPSMTSELETALNISISEEKRVRLTSQFRVIWS